MDTAIVAQVTGCTLVPLTGKRNEREGVHLSRQMRSRMLATWTLLCQWDIQVELPRQPCDGVNTTEYNALHIEDRCQ